MSKTITVNLDFKSYNVYVEANSINMLYKFVDVSKHAFIITDKNVNKLYGEIVASQFVSSDIFAITPGEGSKSFIDLIAILNYMQEKSLDKSTLVIGLGGGVVGDLAGLVASLYLRGVDYLSIPTTTLSQVDSSVGGKVAINLNGVKNVVGTFYHPKYVIIDPETLNTLAYSEYNSGLVEAVKMGLLFDKDLFSMFLKDDYRENIEEIIIRAIRAKKVIVQIDEKDLNQRQLLNFGHTLGHAIEAKYKLSHGESVMLGMIYTVNNEKIREDLISIAKNLGLSSEIDLSADLYDLMVFDKKITNDKVIISNVDKVGHGYLSEHNLDYLWGLLNVK